MKNLTSLTLALAFSSPVLAQDKLVAPFTSLPKTTSSSSGFNKWVYNTSLQTVKMCWGHRHKGVALPKIFDKAIIGTSNWTKPEEVEATCTSIEKNGITPVCTSASFTIENAPKERLTGYLVASEEKKIIIKGDVKCSLNEDKTFQQSYINEFPYKWLEKPEATTLASGKKAKVGQMLITVPDSKDVEGKTYSEIWKVVIDRK